MERDEPISRAKDSIVQGKLIRPCKQRRAGPTTGSRKQPPSQLFDATSFVVSPDAYQTALVEAGLNITDIRNRHAYAIDFYERMKAKAESEGPQPFGLHLLMGEDTQTRLTNAYQAVIDGIIALVEIVAKKEST